MSRLALIALLAIGLLAGLITFAPLGTVLSIVKAGQPIAWTRAEGTISNGRLEGLTYDGRALGSADLRLLPAGLLTGNVRYAVDWEGEEGRGAGNLSVGGGSLAVSDFKLEFDLGEIQDTALWIQQSGGLVQTEGELIRFKGPTCVRAEGVARSDVLERNREILGAGWSTMQGDLRCENGDLVIPLEASNNSGTRFLAQIRVAPGQTGRFDARVSGMIPRDLEFALPIAGFQKVGRDYVYSFEPTQPSETVP